MSILHELNGAHKTAVTENNTPTVVVDGRPLSLLDADPVELAAALGGADLVEFSGLAGLLDADPLDVRRAVQAAAEAATEETARRLLDGLLAVDLSPLDPARAGLNPRYKAWREAAVRAASAVCRAAEDVGPVAESIAARAVACGASWASANAFGSDITQAGRVRSREPAVAEDGAPVEEKKSRLKFEDAGSYLARDHTPTWLIEGLISRGESLVVGGPSKALKTSIALDVAVSLATGAPALGHFKVPKRARVAVVSGESGGAALSRTLLRVLDARGKTPDDLRGWMFIEETLPRAADKVDMADMVDHLKRVDAEVVFIDPVYLFMGGEGVDAANMFSMGEVLRNVADAVRETRPDLTLALVHHSTKLLKAGDKMTIGHLSHVGLEQWGRQFLLISRREEYQHDGRHAMWLSFGGSLGHCGALAVDVDEGTLGADFSGRKWDVRVETMEQSKQTEARVEEDKEFEKMKKQDMCVLKAVAAVVSRNMSLPASKTDITPLARMNPKNLGQVLDRLVESGQLVVERTTKTNPKNGSKVTYNGYSVAGEVTPDK